MVSDLHQLALPAGGSDPWSRRTGAPERPRQTGPELPRHLRRLANKTVVAEDKTVVAEDEPASTVRVEPTAPRCAKSSRRPCHYRAIHSGPVPCHSQRSRPVPSGQPRTTPRRAQPAQFPDLAGEDPTRSGFGSRGSPVQIRPSRPPARTPAQQGRRRPLTRLTGARCA
jgi:hypothetical protein